jgi:alpha/beta superfamily hydrolase
MSLATLTKQFIRPNGRFLICLKSEYPTHQRQLSTKKLTPTITFLTNSETPIKSVKGNPSKWEHSSEGRPLTIMLCWLMAKNNAVNKYANFYLDKGFDVMTVRITPAQLLLPTSANRVIKDELMPLLKNCDHKQSLIHGFSVGGYVFAQMLRLAHEQPEQYKEVVQKMVGQIWDSVVDVQGTAIGVSKSVFPNSPFPQKLLKDYIDFHMKAMYKVSTKHYYVSHEYFYDRPLHAPALFLNSQNDPISPVEVIEAVQKVWSSNGIRVTQKLWPNTPHVGHMQRHPEEYKKTVTDFLTNIGLKPEKGRLADTRKERLVVPEYAVIG